MRYLLVFALAALLPAQRRPLTHGDFDAWKSISGQRLSPNGRYVGYGVFPQEGDGEVILLDTQSNAEIRVAAGERPQPLPPDPDAENPFPIQRSATIAFTADHKFAIVSTFPSRLDMDAAKRARKAAAEMPKGGMAIVNLETREVTRIANVRNFQVAEELGGFVVYSKEAEPAAAPSPKKKAEADGDAEADQRRGGGPAGGGRGGATGTPLVIRTLATGAERAFEEVGDYSLTRDGKALAYIVNAKNAEQNGVFTVDPLSGAAPAAIVQEKAKFSRLTWDERQERIAFAGDNQKIYLWNRAAGGAADAISGDPPASDKGALSFSRDGARLYFGVAKPAPKPAPADPAVDKPVYDLWHFQDDFIQPMQKSRAAQERNRTYRTAYHIAAKKVVPLADATLPDVQVSETGEFGFGQDDRAYRREVEFDKRYADLYLVDTATGARKKVASKQAGQVQWSHEGNFALHFDGKDWTSIAAPSGERVNLTAKLNVRFFDEDDDHPDTPRSYGFGGWLRDGKSVLLYDRYDVWQVAADGSSAVNVTDGMGRAEGIVFRVVRLAEDPRERGIDPAKPLLLRAESLDTRESGFYRDRVGGTQRPERIVWGPRNYGNPVKARNADVLLFTATRFDEYPELQLTDLSFKAPRKLTNLGNQMSAYAWGTSELVSFRSIDGRPLKATLVKPANFDPKKKYPMVVYIYERLSQNVHSFVAPSPSQNVNPSFYASNGYLILYPDIVYRIGYPGESALKCVLPAIETVVARGFVDEQSIGIQGHSWGGYQIAYMVTQTNRFKAAAAGAPVSNMFSAYNGIRWGPGLPRQFQYERTQSRIGGTPWQFPLRFLENSPIFHADKVQTPLLLLHNDQDDAVPWYQGIELFLGLRRLGKEAYMFTYNGEPHGIRKRVNQKDYARRTQEFFDFNLKGAKKPEWMERGRPYLEKEDPAAAAAASSDQR